MKVTGSAVLHAPPEQVFDALTDPRVLVRTLPGCQRLEQVSEELYRATVTVGVGAVRGTYSGEVALTDVDRPRSCVLRGSGAGGPGTVQADVKVTLSPEADGTTRLEYDADAVVGGMLAGVGQRVIGAVSKKLAGEFFQAVDAILMSPEALAEPAPAPTTAEGAPATEAAPAATTAATAVSGRVFTAPAPTAASSGRSDFILGAAFGAAVALLGVLIGWGISH